MFKSPYIKITEHGIDLIKDHQVDMHIDYQEITTIIFKKGYLTNNWGLSLVLSFLLTGSTLIWGLRSTMAFEIQSVPSSNVKSYIAFQLIVPWLLFIGGSVWMYLATRQSPMISIKTHQKTYKTALKEFVKQDKLNELIDFLAERVELIKQYKD